MKNWTEWFYTRKERKNYIKKQRKIAKAQGKTFRVLKRSYCIQRCTGKIMYFADLAKEE